MDSLEEKIEELILKKKLKLKLKSKKMLNGLSLVDRIIAEKEESARLAKLKLEKGKNTKKNIAKFNNILSDFNYPNSKIETEFKQTVLVKSIEPTIGESKIINSKDIEEKKIVKKDNNSKKLVILKLRDAILAHKKQMSLMQIFVRTGNFQSINSTYPKDYTVCKFGSWYYTRGLMFASLTTYSKLDQIHQIVHDYYLKIFSLFEKKIVGSILNSKKRQELARDKEIQSLWRVLKNQSVQFTKAAILFENDIKALTNDEFNAFLS